MRLTIDTDEDTYGDVVATIRAAFGILDEPKVTSKSSGKAPPVTNGEEEDDFFPGGWTTKRLNKFADYLAPDAAEAVRYIAANAPAASMDDTIAHMGKVLGFPKFNGQSMGGRMASVGFAVNAISGVNAAPYDTDRKHRLYRMDERVAKVLLDRLGSPAES